MKGKNVSPVIHLNKYELVISFMKEWITIMTFTYPHEAYVIKGALESEGIETFLKDELTIQVDNFLSNAMGGVRLQVPKEQVIQAQEVLKANGYFDKNDHIHKIRKKIIKLKNTEYDVKFCPFCHSDNISIKKRPTILTLIPIFLLNLPLPLFRKNYYCHNCEMEWVFKHKSVTNKSNK